MFRGRIRKSLLAFMVISMVVPIMPSAFAQFLQLGPFAVNTETEVRGVYTTNVEEERPSETDEKREDYYGIWALRLDTRANLSRHVEVNADAGMAIEKHWNRPDLDNENEPFSRAAIETEIEISRYLMSGRALYERTAEANESAFVPGNRKRRDVRDETELGAAASWEYGGLSLSTDYEFTTERHKESEFQDADEDETTIDSIIIFSPWTFVSVQYEDERTRTDLINDGEEPEWEQTETLTINLDWLQEILRRPQITYSIGVEKEDEDGEEGEWEFIHIFGISDEAELSDSLRYDVGVQYTYEDEEEADDISLIYSGTIEQNLGRSARHSFRATREPVETLGSTEDTDNTTYMYSFEKEDLFIYNLNFNFSVMYEIDRPLAEGDEQLETERTYTYTAGLGYLRELTRQLEREVRYDYSREDSNLEEEELVEHRVTISFLYTF